MDLAALVTNRPLLAQLSAEYEELKRSGAAVDYKAWIKRRLAQAAAASFAGASQHPGGGAAFFSEEQQALASVQQRQALACAQQRLAYRTQLRQRQQVGAAASALQGGEPSAPSVGWKVRAVCAGRREPWAGPCAGLFQAVCQVMLL
jgi:hypothetical protein